MNSRIPECLHPLLRDDLAGLTWVAPGLVTGFTLHGAPEAPRFLNEIIRTSNRDAARSEKAFV